MVENAIAVNHMKMKATVTNVVKRYELEPFGTVEIYLSELNKVIRVSEDNKELESVGKESEGYLCLYVESCSIIESHSGFQEGLVSIDTGCKDDAYLEIKGTVRSFYWSSSEEIYIFVRVQNIILEMLDIHKHDSSLKPGASICVKCWAIWEPEND